ncbi:MAG TPA: PEP-CTERM sorting domain-containing protein [Bryobacteraceae bacterium]|nr:PEP-CTERM sorting domain-containing protein [Bryobacteraceae bacterium]
MRFLTLAGIILLAGPLLASPISYVTTNSYIFSGGVQNNYDSVNGLSQHVGSCYADGGTGTVPCASISSTPSTNTLGLTSASVAITNGQSYDPQNGVTGYADSSAYANLATGKVGVYATGLPCSPQNALCSDQGEGVAEMQDALTFTNTTGTVQDITLSWSFDGSISPNDAEANSTFISLFCFGSGITCFGDPNAGIHTPNSESLFEYQDADGTVTNTQPSEGWVSTSIMPGANGTSETFEGTFAVPTGLSTDSLNAYLYASCLMATCDFSNTGQFSIGGLPDGVSFTSSSGVLLTAATPEPNSWLLCLAAIAAAVLVRRRRWLRDQL